MKTRLRRLGRPNAAHEAGRCALCQMLTARKGQRPSAWIDWSEARRVMVLLAPSAGRTPMLGDYGGPEYRCECEMMRQVNWEGYKLMILERFDSKYDCAV